MEINGIASTFLVIGYLLLSLVTVGAFVGIAAALSKLNAKLEELTAKADPLLSKADQILTITNEKIGTIGDRAESILAQGEGVAEDVHVKVDKTATAVQRTIHAPIITLNSLAAGVSRGVERFGQLQKSDARSEEIRIPATAAVTVAPVATEPVSVTEDVRIAPAEALRNSS